MRHPTNKFERRLIEEKKKSARKGERPSTEKETEDDYHGEDRGDWAELRPD